jgi:hypothetical protein
MCSILVSNAISDALAEFVQDQKMFTAFEVTKRVREQISDTVLHREVRQEVHNGFDFLSHGYQRTPVLLIVAGNPQVFVYHPVGTDATDHPQALKDTTLDTDADDTDSSSSVQASLPDGVYSTTKEKRLTIPKKILQQVDPVGGSFDVMVNGDLLCLKKNADGRIRVAAGRLGGGSNFKITVGDTDNTIHVSPA